MSEAEIAVSEAESAVTDRAIVAHVAAAYFENNHVRAEDIPSVISQIATSLANVGAPSSGPDEAQESPKLTRAQIRKSITPTALISFEDNKPYKMLRRHLAVRGMSPQEYRAKWGLPSDYPMVAPAYSEARSEFARSIGLGARARQAAEAKAKAPGARRGGPRGKSRQVGPSEA